MAHEAPLSYITFFADSLSVNHVTYKYIVDSIPEF